MDAGVLLKLTSSRNGTRGEWRAVANETESGVVEPEIRVRGCAILRIRGITACGGAHAPPNFQTGMPSFLALSARFAEMPEPGNTMTPIGRTSSIWSLRLNGAAPKRFELLTPRFVVLCQRPNGA